MSQQDDDFEVALNGLIGSGYVKEFFDEDGVLKYRLTEKGLEMADQIAVEDFLENKLLN